MGKLINWNDKDKFRKAVAQYLNVTDVIKDGASLVDANGIVDLSIITSIQQDIAVIFRILDVDPYYRDERNEIYTDELGSKYTDI